MRRGDTADDLPTGLAAILRARRCVLASVPVGGVDDRYPNGLKSTSADARQLHTTGRHGLAGT